MMAVADNAGLEGGVGMGLGVAMASSQQGPSAGSGARGAPGSGGAGGGSSVSVGQSQGNGVMEEGKNSGRGGNVSNDSMRELEDLLKKLNPLAKEFVPPSRVESSSGSSGVGVGGVGGGGGGGGGGLLSSLKFPKPSNQHQQPNLHQTPPPQQQQQQQQQQPPPQQHSQPQQQQQQRKQNGYNTGKKRYNNRQSKAQREECIRRTVYVSDIDQQVTEEQLAALFINCGQVIDCRVCGDPNSVLRFAFVEFTDEEGARQALNLAGTMLGFYPVRVLPSKTAIVPVNPTFLPRSEDERQMCARTIYCTNIDKKVSQADVKLFFESLCGEVSRLRLLGDYHHSTRIAFVEFALAESAMAALNCSGAILGSLPIRVSPSKTPVRPRSPRPNLR